MNETSELPWFNPSQKPRPDADPHGELAEALRALADQWQGCAGFDEPYDVLGALKLNLATRSRAAYAALCAASAMVATYSHDHPRYVEVLSDLAHRQLELNLIRRNPFPAEPGAR